MPALSAGLAAEAAGNLRLREDAKIVNRIINENRRKKDREYDDRHS
ncbi:MAG TPA: hypothetical protein PKL29_02895 [Methanothrix sp.]|nr:hypothetical protein [Methanothrix sp.]